MKRSILIVFFSSIVILFLVSYSFAILKEPPPSGKVWIEAEEKWVLVVAPPGDGPYVWREGKWVIDPTSPPAGKEWILGHWAPGHRGPGGRWIPGHWK